MDECSACHVDYYYNADMRVLYSSVCDHRVCEACIARLFQPGPYKCPECDKHLTSQDFSHFPRETRQIDSEVKVRRKISDIFCKTEEDFANAEQYNDYLMEKEDMIYRLVNPASQDEVRETWQMVEKYREQNAEQIRRVKRLAPRRKFQKIIKIIEEEGTFYSHVNSDWGESASANSVEHPFKSRFASLLANPPQDIMDVKPMSPMDSPMAGGSGGESQAKTLARHMSGAGGLPDAYLKKARHFLFNDLLAATSSTMMVDVR